MGARKAPTDPQTSCGWFLWAASAAAEEACVACIVRQTSTRWDVIGSVGDQATGDVEERI